MNDKELQLLRDSTVDESKPTTKNHSVHKGAIKDNYQ